MYKRKRAPWRQPAVALIVLAIFVLIKWSDPTKVDKVLDDLSRRWVGWALAQYYTVVHNSPSQVVVGLFEDSFRKDVSKQPPTLEHYAQIIERLIGFSASEIVIDMDMRLDTSPGRSRDSLVAALKHARGANIPVIIPYMPDDEVTCPDGDDLSAVTSVQCVVAARGAVQYVADDSTSYYPLFVAYDNDGQSMIPSLAWIAYLAYPGLRPPIAGQAGFRDPLNDDMFPVWRTPLSANGYVFCSFAVRQLLPDAAAGESSCPSQSSNASAEAQGNISIQSLVKNKIVLIGQAGQDNKDWIETPFDVDQPGVMLHATVLDDLLTFGPNCYPVNRDGVVLSLGKHELRMSELCFLIFCVLPLLLIPFGRTISKFRIARPAGGWIEQHTTITGAAISFCVLPVFRPSLAILNAFVVFASTFLILFVATLAEKIAGFVMERRNA